ncbi:MAG TPA: SDR family NAD(P)-dependent oxidoreductase [Streptosporangiaceae bacterium]|nr:SDR family NAD(P)-dependent oxidoreductase [Streptosporangiaceae bacterium]
MTTTPSSSTPRALDSAALATGATSGIGRTTAVRLAACGHRVVVADRSSGRVTGIVEGPRSSATSSPPRQPGPQPGGSPRWKRSPPPI